LAFRYSGGMSIGLRDEDRLVSAGGTFTQRSSCSPGKDCELHVTAALSVNGTCTGEVEPCRLLMAQWRGRHIAARLILPALEEAKRQGVADASRLAEGILAVNVRSPLAEAATEIIRSTRARPSSRADVEPYLLMGANGLVNSLNERLVAPEYPVPPGTRNRNVPGHLLQGLIDKCRRIVSTPPPPGKDRFRL